MWKEVQKTKTKQGMVVSVKNGKQKTRKGRKVYASRFVSSGPFLCV